MKIYRIESDKGIGPYKSSFNFDLDIHNDDNHPGPCQEHDNILNNFQKGVHYFGFESIKQLKEWFSLEELEELYDEYFDLIEYKINKYHVLFGNKQIMFDKSNAISSKKVNKNRWLR